MADGTRLPFYRVVQIPIRVRDVKLEEIFVVSQIIEDATLDMLFLTRHDCKMDFARPVVTIGECELVCTDRFRRLMASRVQTIRRTTISPRTEVALSCYLILHNHIPEGLIENLSDQVVLANSIGRPSARGNVIVRCINSTNQVLELAAGLTIGTFTSIDPQDIPEDEGRRIGSERRTPAMAKVLEHLKAMFQKACQDEVSEEQARRLAELLDRYQAVFSLNDQEVGKTDLVKHSIPVNIRQPPPFRTSEGAGGRMPYPRPVGQRND